MMRNLKIDRKIVKSTKSYDYVLPSQDFSKSLADILFEEMDKKNKVNSESAIINAWKPSEKLLIKEIKELSYSVALYLNDIGFAKGDVAHLMLDNSVDFFLPALGVWLCKGVVSPINPIITAKSLSEQFESCKTKVIFCNSKSLDLIQEAFALTDLTITLIKMDEIKDLTKSIIDVEFKKESSVMRPNDTAMIFWSSGTTGDPKGIQYSFDMLARMIRNEETIFFKPIEVDFSTFVMTTSFYHTGGFTFALINGIKNFNNVIIFDDNGRDVTAQDLYQACHLYQPTLMKLVSSHAILLGYSKPDEGLDTSSLKHILPMGAPVYQGLKNEIKTFFPNFKDLLINYGSTETYLIASTNVPGELGFPYPGVEYKIRDVENSQELLGPDQVGEILTRTPYMMKGYLHSSAPYLDQDGFGSTGDLGFYRSNDASLVFKSRLKDLIKYKGNHLYPMEIENIVKTHPKVAEVAIFGMPEPSVQELVTALVVKLNNDDDLTANEVKQWVIDSGVENYKYIRGGVKFVSNLPKNSTGKLLRRQLLAEFYKIKSLD